MLLTHAIAGNPLASTFVYSTNPSGAAEWATAILDRKLATYRNFNHTYPGYGGFLPTFEGDLTSIWPTKDWNNRLSAADNG